MAILLGWWKRLSWRGLQCSNFCVLLGSLVLGGLMLAFRLFRRRGLRGSKASLQGKNWELPDFAYRPRSPPFAEYQAPAWFG